MSVSQAKSLMTSLNREDGTFLVRFSSQSASFALSVLQKGVVCHCRIDSYRTSTGILYGISTRQCEFSYIFLKFFC
jgi:hypothetical protein